MTKQKQSNAARTQSLPWYRYGMVWLVILLPLTVVIASFYTFFLAYQNAPLILVKPPVDKVAVAASRQGSGLVQPGSLPQATAHGAFSHAGTPDTVVLKAD